jgi:hypothetical protein
VGATEIEDWFPLLSSGTYKITSPVDLGYNCIAWAAEDIVHKWWPDRLNLGFWPNGVPRAETLDAFEQAYATHGYKRCLNGAPVPGFQKIVVYVSADGKPTHAARQLPDGTWTSKLGDCEDIMHVSPDGVSGDLYGSPALFMMRPDPNHCP